MALSDPLPRIADALENIGEALGRMAAVQEAREERESRTEDKKEPIPHFGTVKS